MAGIIDAAGRLAECGAHVVPCHFPRPDGSCSCGDPKHHRDVPKSSCGKHPVGARWGDRATADPAEARRLFEAAAQDLGGPPNVSIVCNERTRLLALDVDSAEGERLLAELSGGDLPPTWEDRSTKGRHLVYHVPAGIDPQLVQFKDADGEEALRILCGANKQVVACPSVHHSGRPYRWAEGRAPWQVPLADMPRWLVNITCPPDKRSDVGGADPDSPGNDFNRKVNFAELLAAAGWRKCADGAKGVSYWARPERDSHGATLGHGTSRVGTPALFVFHGGCPYLDSDRYYDAFGFLAHWKYQGDFSACARALANGEYDGTKYGKQQQRPTGSFGVNGQHIGGANGKAQANGTHPGGQQRDDQAGELVVRTASDITPGITKWVWPGRIPRGMLSNLVARPKAGKSVLTCEIAACISRGRMWPDGSGFAPRGDVFFMAKEDDLATVVVPRLMAADADRTRVHFIEGLRVTGADGEQFTLHIDLTHIARIKAAIKKKANEGAKPVALVVDPAGSYIGGATDAHRDNEVRQVLQPLADMVAELGMAGIIVCHTNKAVNAFADDAILGSRAFSGIVRANWHLANDPDDRKRKLFLAGGCTLALADSGLAFRINSCPTTIGNPAKIEWEPDVLEGVTADDYMGVQPGGGRPGPEPSQVERAVRFLTDLLTGEEHGVESTVVDRGTHAAGITEATLRRAKQQLEVTSKRQAGGPKDNKRRKWYCGFGDDWTPPELEPEEKDANTPTTETDPQDPENMSTYRDDTTQPDAAQGPAVDVQTAVEPEHLQNDEHLQEPAKTGGTASTFEAAPVDAHAPVDAQVKPESERLHKAHKKRTKRTARPVGAQVPRDLGKPRSPVVSYSRCTAGKVIHSRMDHT